MSETSYPTVSTHTPVLALCGYSGSGKTTLVEQLIPWLTAQNLKVAVIKHDAHGLILDKEGKDTDRFFKAGADVIGNGPGQRFTRKHQQDTIPLHMIVNKHAPFYDLILVEGHKQTPGPSKIWLKRDSNDNPPEEVGKTLLNLEFDDKRMETVTAFIQKWLPEQWLKAPVYAGILFGGKSSRMNGTPKHLIEHHGQTWIENIVQSAQAVTDNIVLLGAGDIPEFLRELPVLPDQPGVKGPMAGMRSAMNWNRSATWLFIACDLPCIDPEALQWLLSTRAPGVWATIPRLPNAKGVEPLLAHYDFRARYLLENISRPCDMADADKVITPAPPEALHTSWQNINTPDDLRLVIPPLIDTRHSTPDTRGDSSPLPF